MKIRKKLYLSFLGIALFVGVVGYISIFLSIQISGLRSIELPMEQNLREVEVSIWEMIHAADSYRFTGNKSYEELYHIQIGDVEEFLPAYQALTDTDEEKKYIEEFSILWEEAKMAGSKMIELTREQKAAEEKFFINVDEADDVLDYAIQSKWSTEDSNLLAKERAVREVEVSIWEAIHAAQQYLGIAENIKRGEQKYIGLEVDAAKAAAKASLVKGDFNILMEKQFEDVEEFLTKYKNLPLEDFENSAIQEFEDFWQQAIAAGREVVSLNKQAQEQFHTLYEKVDKADDVLDLKMQVFIQERIEKDHVNAAHIKTVVIIISILGFLCALATGLLITRFITRSISKLSSATDELSKGKLDTQIEITSNDEIGDLADKFNKMTTGLREVTASRDELNKEINERKKVEQELIETQKKNRTWFDNSPVCTKVLDLDFNLKFMSAAGINALKIDDVTKYYGTPYPFDFFPEAFKDSMTINLEKVKETGEVITGEAPLCDIEGNELWFQATIVPLRDVEGRIDSIIVVSVDINKRKKMEATLIQSERLKAMGTVTAGIAHDFNNILAVISGTTQVLELNIEDNKKLMNGLRTIHKVCNDGAEIVRRMRLATKKEPDTTVLTPVDIKSVLEQSIGFTRPRWMNIAKASGVDYDIDIDGIIEVPIVMGIESELREVFTNIINNALDAMEAGGRLSFRTWQNEGNSVISISDTGEGMSDEVKDRVFEPFYTTKRAKGSGLGLSVSHGIMKRYSGSIEVESEEGEGTTFTLRLPITVTSVQRSEPPVGANGLEIRTNTLSILVVDDNKDMHSFLEAYFVDSGHKAKSVGSGERAIEVLETETFDLVLCDIVMPGISGYDVVAVLNSQEKKPKIGMMTGWSEKIKAKEGKGLNIDFIIKKPFELSVLADHINDAFGLGRES
ncbi:MAG: response regulator [Candidatus Scalindua sp.]|nr:response regulator [Candidatus Scalindua sp.]